MRFFLGFLLLLVLIPSSGLAGKVYRVQEAVPDQDGVQRLEMAADSYFFDPNYIVVQSGMPVELTVVRKSWLVPHNFVLEIPEADIHIDREIETEGTRIRFTPVVQGKFTFYCDKKLLFFPSHREEGMEGILHVKP